MNIFVVLLIKQINLTYKKICDNLQKDVQQINNINIIIKRINRSEIESLKNPTDKPILEKLIWILKKIVKEFPPKFKDYRQDINEKKSKKLNKGKTPTNNAPINGKGKGNTKVNTTEIKRKSDRINSLISKLRDYTEYCNTIEEAKSRKLF